MSKPIACSFVLCLLLAGCGGKVPVPPVSKTDLIREYMRGNGTNSSAAAVHGKETGFAYGAIAGVGDSKSNGVGFLHTYEDAVSSVRINLNILPAPAGQHYIVWITDAAARRHVRAGELLSIVGDARHSVVFETSMNLQSLLTVIVTRESTLTPETPGTLLAEGTLKEVKRDQ